MQRYTVTLIPDTGGGRPSIIVPFAPSALVAALGDEIFKRSARHLHVPVTKENHSLTLRIRSQTGPVLDPEDVLSDVSVPSEVIFAVFSAVTASKGSASLVHLGGPTTTISAADQPIEGATISIRIITPESARQERTSLKTFPISVNATIRQLHEQTARHLQLSSSLESSNIVNECNCSVARKISDLHTSSSTTFLVHDKSVVKSVEVFVPNKVSLEGLVREQLGADLDVHRKIHYHGGEERDGQYTRLPVVAICSQRRHASAYAASPDSSGDSIQTWRSVLDLHTAEMPIHSAAGRRTISESGLLDLAIDGVLELFAVNRTAPSTTPTTPSIGRDAIYRNRSHWYPQVRQSDRGISMLLASLRVTASIVQDMDHATQDAIFHCFDLGFAFPPALRTLYLLMQGKTPSATECAALSHSVFHFLESFIPTELVGTDRKRLFEGTRLLFGFLLEKGKGVKTSHPGGESHMPYLAAFENTAIRDCYSNEPVMEPVQTQRGLVEKSYYQACSPGGLLSAIETQFPMTEERIDPKTLRIATLSGGVQAEFTTFSPSLLRANYSYADAGDIAAVIDDSEIHDLHHLAELCGRNKLAVHKPSQLASAIAPCLTFDRDAHVAVYLGEQACGEPGRSSLVFRPTSGTETVDNALIEQLIAPVLKMREAEGTGVFDTSSGAGVRKLEAPDEILVFCVDCSASMRTATDFAELQDDEGGNAHSANDTRLQPVVEGEYFTRARYEDVKEELCQEGSFEDMVGIVADAAAFQRDTAARGVLSILIMITATQLSSKLLEVDCVRRRGNFYASRDYRASLETCVKKLKTFYAGLKTHEALLQDFLIYRAQSVNSLANKWTWSPGDVAPARATGAQNIPALPTALTEIPDELRCPISHEVLLDAVKATDGHVYSKHALEQWFAIRKSSPLHGTALEDTTMTEQEVVSGAAHAWVNGKDLIWTNEHDGPSASKRRKPVPADRLTIKFDSHFGAFERTVAKDLTLNDLYKLVFRGLQARHSVFQLHRERDNRTIFPMGTTIAAWGIQDNESLTIRIAEDAVISASGRNSASMSGELALIKVYNNNDTFETAYWTSRYNPGPVSGIIWKYWRSKFAHNVYSSTRDLQVWSDLENTGDGTSRGVPNEDPATRLSFLLNRNHCFGHLGEETVYKNAKDESSETLVLKVRMMHPWRPKKRTILSRLEVLKSTFEASINRMLAYNYKTHVGLVTISTSSNVSVPVTHVVENFRRATNEMKASGDTALFDGLSLARDILKEYGKKYPEAKKRIIVISDGEDTSSVSATAESVAWNMLQDSIAVDSISLGDEDNPQLRAISHVLGCYKFQPYSLANSLAVAELEPFLSQTERPLITTRVEHTTSRMPRMSFKRYFLQHALGAGPTIMNDHQVPKRKEHPNQRDNFICLADAARLPTGQATSSNGTSRSNLRTTRLLNEMRQIVAAGPHPNYDVYVSESDMAFFKVVMSGPAGSPYEGGTFLLYVHAEERYPAHAPKARFITKIKHVNVSQHGKICMSMLDRDWTSDTSMSRLLDSIYGLLVVAQTSDPVNMAVTLGYHHDQEEYHDEVREWVTRYASRNREQWKYFILGGENWDESSGDDEEDEAVDDDSNEEDGDEDYAMED